MESQRLAMGRRGLESPTDVGGSCHVDDVAEIGRRKVGNWGAPGISSSRGLSTWSNGVIGLIISASCTTPCTGQTRSCSELFSVRF